MKHSCDDRNSIIYRLWWEEGRTPEEISQMPFPLPLSRRRVENIIYQRGAYRHNAERNERIKACYLEAIETGMTNAEAIHHAYLHQPPEYLSLRTVKHVISCIKRQKQQERRANIERALKKLSK